LSIDLDPKFLKFFFSRVRTNTYIDRPYTSTFPYVSLCGRERNFIRCDDVPFVLTRLHYDDNLFEFCHIPSSLFSIRFEPARIYVKRDTGRLYHPMPTIFNIGIALIKDSIAEQLSSQLIYDDMADDLPTGIEWKGEINRLETNERTEQLVCEHSRFSL
jgi:hypothetical protein